jgi:general secretion pathway protein C
MDISMKNSLMEVIKIILLASVIYLMWSIAKILLPIVGVDYNVSKNIEYYANYNLNTFKKKKITHKQKKPKPKKVKKIKEEKLNFKLIAIYADGHNSVVTIGVKRRIVILGIGEQEQNFKLIKVTNNDATFSKNNKEYIIFIGERNNAKKTNKRVSQINKSIKENKEQQTSDIKRKQIRKYKNNTNAIWKDISIKRVVGGYSIGNIKPKSTFAQIGLKKGDIIKTINNKKLKTNKNVIDMYKKLDTISYIKLELIRDGELREIEFNIE